MMNHKKTFFHHVIPAMLSLALSGVYAIVDGFFVGNAIGDVGLSAINIAYPIVAVLQAVGTGMGMGGAVLYAIYRAKGAETLARQYIAGSLWLMLVGSVVVTAVVFGGSRQILAALGASGRLLDFGDEYITVIALGTCLQIFGTGLVPFMRNYGGSFWAMMVMVGGFVTNIILDYAFVWVWEYGMYGAALATIIGQAVTMAAALLYCLHKNNIAFYIERNGAIGKIGQIIKIGLAPFGLTLVPNVSLVIINKFSSQYGGQEAIATYACISYVICIIYLVLQGVGDGSQPLMSRFYGAKDEIHLAQTKRLAYEVAVVLGLVGAVVMFVLRDTIGILFGASAEVHAGIMDIMPIFLVSIPFVAITRIATAAFYATEKSALSYILTCIEPVLMLVLMLLLPPLWGGQVMIWWSTVIARIVTAILAAILTIAAAHTMR